MAEGPPAPGLETRRSGDWVEASSGSGIGGWRLEGVNSGGGWEAPAPGRKIQDAALRRRNEFWDSRNLDSPGVLRRVLRGGRRCGFLRRDFGGPVFEESDDGPAEFDEGFFRVSEAAVAPVEDAPLAFELSTAEGQSHEGAFGDFGVSCPGSEDADPQAEFNQLFDGFHAAEFDEGIEDHVFLTEVIFNQAEGVTGFAVENVILARDLGPGDITLKSPRVLWGEEEDQFIGKQGDEFHGDFAGGLKCDGQVDPAGIEQLEGAFGIDRFDRDLTLGEAFFQFAQDGGEEVLAGRAAGPEAEAAFAPFAEFLERIAGFLHRAENAGSVMQELFAGLGENNFFAHPV